MNIVRQLRQKKGIQQKELALEIGVTNATVSDWEHGRKNPSGERLRKLSEFFDVEPMVILGEQPDLSDPPQGTPTYTGKKETDNIIAQLLEKLDKQPKTDEARILATGIDKLPQEQREQALAVVRAMFAKHADYFEKGAKDESEH